MPSTSLTSPAPAFTLTSDDAVLNAVIDAVQKNEGFHVGITLFIGGVLVSGEMMSDQEYLAGVGKTFIDAGQANPGQYTTQLGRALSESAGRATTQAGGHRFVNLRNVRVLSPGSPLMPCNGYWRGSAASVDGYSWGLLA